MVLALTWKELRTEIAYSVLILLATVAKILAICLQQFGTVYVQDIYTLTGRSHQEAENYLSVLNLIANLSSFGMTLGFGYVADRVALWKLITVVNFMVMGLYAIMIGDIVRYKGTDISEGFTIGYCGALCVYHTSFMLALTWLSKILNEHTRGTIFNVNGFIGSTGILIFQAVGGKAYAVNKVWPFMISFILYAIVSILILVLGITKKLREK